MFREAPPGLEPGADGLEDRCSIRLSYGAREDDPYRMPSFRFSLRVRGSASRPSL